MAIQNSIIGTTPAAFYTSTGDTAVTCVYLCNTSNATVAFSLYAVPLGGTAVANTKIYDSVVLTSKDTYVIDMEKLVLSDGDTLHAEADQPNAVTITVSSVAI